MQLPSTLISFNEHPFSTSHLIVSKFPNSADKETHVSKYFDFSLTDHPFATSHFIALLNFNIGDNIFFLWRL